MSNVCPAGHRSARSERVNGSRQTGHNNTSTTGPGGLTWVIVEYHPDRATWSTDHGNLVVTRGTSQFTATKLFTRPGETAHPDACRQPGLDRRTLVNPGDTAWVLASAALVMLMTPGLAFFYGGMVRSKSVLNMLMMNFITLGIVAVLWE